MPTVLIIPLSIHLIVLQSHLCRAKIWLLRVTGITTEVGPANLSSSLLGQISSLPTITFTSPVKLVFYSQLRGTLSVSEAESGYSNSANSVDGHIGLIKQAFMLTGFHGRLRALLVLLFLYFLG